MKAITREWLEWKIDVTSIQMVHLAYKLRHLADVYATLGGYWQGGAAFGLALADVVSRGEQSVGSEFCPIMENIKRKNPA